MEEQEAVTYQIFPQFDEIEKNQQVLSCSVQEYLEDFMRQSFAVVCPVAEGYIWQHEPFNLQVYCSLEDVQGKSPKGRESLYDFSERDSFVPHLAGKVRFGDNLEDEWLVVYLLFEISRRFPSVSITVRDSDGEFLLIEASYFIPKWLNPENSHNRIFIRHGAVHIVPPVYSGASRPRKYCGPTSLQLSLQVLAAGAIDTNASPEFQKVILDRISGYPGKARKNVHRVRCKIPLPVAQILKNEAQLIALAVESFYSRDIDSMKVVSRMETFSPSVLVDMVVPMSRAMYAQLVQQVFQAPRNYQMPALSSPGFKEAEIGMKIAVGFEILFWERSSSEVLETLPSEGIGNVDYGSSVQELQDWKKRIPVNDVSWQRYRASLEKRGYFLGLLEGSKEHKELLQAAVAEYRSTDLFSRTSIAMQAPAKRISQLLSIPHTVEDFLSGNLDPSDDDHWLYDGEADLASEMMARQKEMDAYEAKQEKRRSDKRSAATTSDQKGEDMQSFHAEEVVKNVQSFVDKISSFEGAEIPDNFDLDATDDQSVDLSMSKLLKEMESVFGAKEISTMLAEGFGSEDFDSSSDIDLDDSGSEDEMEVEDESRGKKEGPDAKGQEQDENGAFRNEYSDVLDEQLRSSSLAKSFAKRREVDSVVNESAKISVPDCQKAVSEQDDEDDNDLVDVDVNLVESLLKSFMFQQGMPGPTSNLLGAMGIELPDVTDKT